MDEIDILQAEILRTLAHPRRLRIIHRLSGGPVEVGRIAADLGISQPNASQHLAVMRAVGVVEAERNGREVRYRLSDQEIVAACALMRGVLARRLDRLAGLSDAAHRGPGQRRTAVPLQPGLEPAEPDIEPGADLTSAPPRPLALATAPTR